MTRTRSRFPLGPIAFVTLLAAAGGAAFAQPGLGPPPPAPPQNLITESKRVLGKILFWDEQLSVDGTVACATCHLPQQGGSDPRRARAPGFDNAFNTPDDVFASPGTVRSDALRDYLRDLTFGLTPQVTGRSAPSPINAVYSPLQFWDGRSDGSFEDPVTGAVLIPNGGSLESQASAPPMSSAEMAHDGVSWAEITTRLASVRPLALATAHTADVAAVLASRPTYGQLFAAAFGDSTITAARVSMAIATYERTLVANDTPWDRTQRGQAGGMTAAQQQGLNTFNAASCAVCHTPPLFSNVGQGPQGAWFRNIGLRPPNEDVGRQAVTNVGTPGQTGDAGRFKVPSLRNVGLKHTFMHNGSFTDLNSVMQFYARQPIQAPIFPQFQQNIDPVMQNVRFPPQQNANLVDFLANALTDARVRDSVFPFDRPTLYTQRAADRPASIPGTAVAGTGGFSPRMIADSPPMIGNERFRLGLDRALGGAQARLLISTQAPVGGRVVGADKVFGPMTTDGTGAAGYATAHWPLFNGQALPGQTMWAQWVITDPAAPGGEALSDIVSIRFFCPSTGCDPACPADFNGSQSVTVQDVYDFLGAWTGGSPLADFNDEGGLTVQDIYDFLFEWSQTPAGPCGL